MNVDWIIFYEDQEFSSDEGSPFDAPRQGVMLIVQRDDFIGYRIEHGKDYFYYEPTRGGFNGCDMFGVYDHLIRSEKPLVFFGRMMSDAEWSKYFAKVKAMIGPKEGWVRSEFRHGKIPE